MATIQTTTRKLSVKEDYKRVKALINIQDDPWLELTEDESFYGELSQKTHESTRVITINMNYIVEILP